MEYKIKIEYYDLDKSLLVLNTGQYITCGEYLVLNHKP